MEVAAVRDPCSDGKKSALDSRIRLLAVSDVHKPQSTPHVVLTEDQDASPVSQTGRRDACGTTPRCGTFSTLVFSPFVLGDIVSQYRIVESHSRAIEELAEDHVEVI